ncbi:MAG: hypothetical protein JWN38_27 [Candidatus Saccharibacteria bacterium]|nr:hypothetical protein [Candidatus Saccharibacteria bacterium]
MSEQAPEPEPLSDLETQASALLLQAEALLLRPDQRHIYQESKLSFGPGLDMRLRDRFAEPVESIFDERSRFIYLTRPEGEQPFRMEFSLDLTELEENGEIRGLLKRWQSLFDAEEYSLADPEQRLIKSLIELMQVHTFEELLPAPLAARITEDFNALLANGYIHTTCERSLALRDGTEVLLVSDELEGRLVAVYEQDLYTPELSVIVHKSGDTERTVLDRRRDGSLECYTEIADSGLRYASFADPQKVIRSEEGTVEAVAFSFSDEIAVHDAERASGLRVLSQEKLQGLAAALGQIAIEYGPEV